MERQDFKNHCEYELIRENLAELFQKYSDGALNASAAYVESGNLLDYDEICAEGLFFRFYALRHLVKPETKNPEFFAHEGRAEVKLLQQLVTEELHYYLWDKQQILDFVSREFYGYLHDFYTGDNYSVVVRKISLFESICMGAEMTMDDRCLGFVRPYLNYLIGMAGDMTAAEAGRFHDIFAKISEIMAGKAQKLARRQAAVREIEFDVLEKELDAVLQDIQPQKRLEHKSKISLKKGC